MSTPKKAEVIPFQHSFFLLELHSERFIDLVHALKYQGFVVSNTGHANRFRIDDSPVEEVTL